MHNASCMVSHPSPKHWTQANTVAWMLHADIGPKHIDWSRLVAAVPTEALQNLNNADGGAVMQVRKVT